jgi:DNA-binding NarL/FixJ family response regulator
MRVLCVARHTFLSEHLARFFETLGVDTVPCVGTAAAISAIATQQVDAVICDYDLLATMPLANWETNPAFADVPVIAVSLTRHPGEAHVLDVNGIAGFLYLPTLEADDAQRLLAAVRRKSGGINPPNVMQWPGTIPVAQLG